MQIVFFPKGDFKDDTLDQNILDIESTELDSIRNECLALDVNYTLKTANFGSGADWMLILALFFLGDKIDKNFTAWINIGKRVKKLISKSTVAFIDRDAAFSLALNFISTHRIISKIETLKEANFKFQDLSKMLLDRNKEDFISSPQQLYIFHFKINDEIDEVISIRSTGEVKSILAIDFFCN